MMEFETAIFITIIVAVVFVGVIVKEIQIHTERRERFDKSKIKYTDGDNT